MNRLKQRYGYITAAIFGVVTIVLCIVCFAHLGTAKANVLCYIGAFFSVWVAVRAFFYAKAHETTK